MSLNQQPQPSATINTKPNRKRSKWLWLGHRWLGLMMMLPLLVWSVTGAIFLFKPGYDQAYQKLSIVTYPALSWSNALLPEAKLSDVTQLRRLNTILGEHLLVERDGQWQQLSPVSGNPRELTIGDTKALVADAVRQYPERYGDTLIVGDAVNHLRTATGIDITLDWERMTLAQKGADTRWIKRFYRWHYLQWTGQSSIDSVLGVVGLCSLVVLTVLGFVLWLRRARSA